MYEEEEANDDEEEIVEEVGEIAHEDDVDERVEDADRGRNFTFVVVEDDEHVAFVDGALEDDGLNHHGRRLPHTAGQVEKGGVWQIQTRAALTGG